MSSSAPTLCRLRKDRNALSPAPFVAPPAQHTRQHRSLPKSCSALQPASMTPSLIDREPVTGVHSERLDLRRATKPNMPTGMPLLSRLSDGSARRAEAPAGV